MIAFLILASIVGYIIVGSIIWGIADELGVSDDVLVFASLFWPIYLGFMIFLYVPIRIAVGIGEWIGSKF